MTEHALWGMLTSINPDTRPRNTRPPDLPLKNSVLQVMQVRKQQLELDMEQQTGSKLEKEYVKAVYCHPAYLTYI